MIGLCKCANCGHYYTEHEAFDYDLEEKCRSVGHYGAVIECSCGSKSAAGGELSCIDGKNTITVFSVTYDEAKHSMLNKYNAIMLIMCLEKECICATWDNEIQRIVYLKPE